MKSDDQRETQKMMRVVAGLLALTIPLLAGCASPGMKGTPFYTGEYEKRKGPVEDRVNVWPLLYYRDPALSVLWPIMELTEDHFAVRPVYSVYGLEGTQREHNVLWPISQFDRHSGDSRIFPFFWGKDYQVAFPLYWNFGNAFRRGGANAFFPLWILDRDKKNYSFDMLWPAFHFEDLNSDAGSWRAWPVTGHSWSPYDDYRFYVWPLGHIWKDKKKEISGSALFPLYFHRKMPHDENFVSLPYSFAQHRDTRWDFSPFLFCRYNSTDRKSWYSIPYWSSSNLKNGNYWRLVLPLYYDGKEGRTRFVASPLGGWKSDGERTSWLALPGLIGGSHSPGAGSFYVGGVLGHAAWQKDADGSSQMKSHHVLPLYYKDNRSGLILSLPYSSWKSGAQDTSWLILAGLMGGCQSPDAGSFYVGGVLGHAAWQKDDNGSSRLKTHHVFPLYYKDNQSERFLSLPYSSWKSRTQETSWLALLGLVGGCQSPDAGSFFVGGVLGHGAWQKGSDSSRQMISHHVLPLYYKDNQNGRFLSLPYSSWKSGAVERKVFPLLLSSLSSESDRNSLRVLLGLISAEWGKGANQNWVFPLYAYREDYFYTPVAGWNNDGCVYFLTPLVGIKNGEDKGFWIFPLFRYNREASGDINGDFLLWGEFCKRDGYGRSGFFPVYSYSNLGPEVPPAEGKSGYSDYGKELSVLLIAWYKNQGVIHRRDGAEAGRLETTREHSNGIFPLWAYDSVVNDGATGRTADKQLPFYLWQSRNSTWQDAGIHKSEYSLLFDILLHSEENIDNKAGVLKEKSRLLYFLYDSLHEKAAPVNGESARDYTRRRFLWRVFHYEKDNEDVSVDVFPGITYDRKKDGYKKFSFLYRLFAYENTGEKTRIHVLFIPVKR